MNGDPLPKQRHGDYRFVEIGLVLLLCAIYIGLSISFAHSTSATYDETAHLASGYTCLKYHDYRISPTHPPLAKKLAALPLLWQRVWPDRITATDSDFFSSSLIDSERLLHLLWVMSLKYPDSEWNFAHELLYGIHRQTQEKFGANTPLLVPTDVPLNRSDFYNDPDRLLGEARLAILPLALALAVLIYIWARQLYGTIAAGTLSLALFVFDPNFIANGSLVATDVAFALFFFSTIYFYWRFRQTNSVASLVLFAFSCGAAFATKFSAVLLLPIVCAIAIVQIFGHGRSHLSPSSTPAAASYSAKAITQLLVFVFAGLVTLTIIWAAYDFRYSAAADPALAARQEAEADKTFVIDSPTPYGKPGHFRLEQEVHREAAIKALLRKYPAGEKLTDKLIAESIPYVQPGRIGRLILFLNDHRLLPEAYLQGFATLRANSLMVPSYLRGHYSSTGFRSYFLWTFLLKTPLPAIAAILLGIWLAFSRKLPWTKHLSFILLPVAICIPALILARINIGHRHLLHLYPFLYVLAGGLVCELPKEPHTRWAFTSGAIALIAICSSFVFYPLWRPQVVFPHYLAYFNELAGGPLNGWRSLADSNIDWGQDLKGLKPWLDRRGIREPIYLAYFGTADPRYYQIIHKPVPAALGAYVILAPSKEDPYTATRVFQTELRPGDYIAISAQNVLGVRLSTGAREIWKNILSRCTLIDRVGYSIFIYKVSR